MNAENHLFPVPQPPQALGPHGTSPDCAAIWQGLDAEVLDHLKSAVQAMPDSDLVAGAKQLPELMQGLKQDKPNTDLLRQRVLAKMQLKTLPPLVLELLRSATLSEPLLAVLSDKAIEQGLAALMERFGRVPVLAAMWLDERDSVRALAQSCAPAQTKSKLGKPKTGETFKQRFKPLLTVLQPVLADVPYEPPTARPNTRQLPAAAAAQPQSREQAEREIRASSLFKQVQRERNELQDERDGLMRQRDKLSKDVQALDEQLKAARARLAEVEGDWRTRVAQGIADGLNKRMAPWLTASEALALPVSHQADPLERARQLLARQAQEDKRFGTRSVVGQQLAEAQRLLAALQEAQAEALRPLPQLAEEQRALATHIEALQSRLAQTTIQPTRQPVRQLGQALLAIHDMDELQEKKRQVERSMLAEAWSMAMCQQAYDALDRRAMQIYDLHHPATGVHKDEHPPVTPKQYFEHGLRHARPIRLIIDGHNLLPKLKPLIGAEYFSAGQGPNARARALLIERVQRLTELHPLLSADIVFDGPDDQHWSETESLRVWFSGGQGSDRADGRILEALQAQLHLGQRFQGQDVACFVVTEDRDLRLKSQALKAMVVSPLEMWAMVY
ncbi:hypothetical protein [Limnohabitans sp. 2KL-3]|uniref:hypothetical protein n=1 Tax=Limnohabitans sp. 2KL-3 TaxID=1100700 RepID=UPI000A7DA2AB|nr:hypothetical protein [Limnohabitans sp. 2KL-3]